MATTTIISKQDYDARLKSKVGTLMFPSELWDCRSYIDKKKLRENIKAQLPPKKRIYKVLVHTFQSPEFKNIANKSILYDTPMVTIERTDGAYLNEKLNRHMTDYPIGDAIVVYC